MQKNRINITVDADLIEFVKDYAASQRTTVSELFTQFALKLKRMKENDPTEIVLTDSDFSLALFQIMENIKNGEASWKNYDEVFG